MSNVFFELIRVALSTQKDITCVPSAKEWKCIYDMANRQALLGICFVGVQKLRADCKPCVSNLPQSLFMQWLGIVARIQQRNELMDHLSADMWQRLNNEGLDAALLKGQGIALLYGKLSAFRQSGDIDMWVKGGFDKVNDYVQHTFPSADVVYHRFHYDIYRETEVELHFRPTLMRNLFDNRKLQMWCDDFPPQTFIQTDKGFAVPPSRFNRVFILTHIYRHFLFEGVGLRQVMDYYFVLKSNKPSECEKAEAMAVLSNLRMVRFTQAVMWVLNVCLGLSADYLLCEPNEKEGRFLLSEIELTGNFGQSDMRYIGNTRLKMMTRHGIHLLRHYPSEVLWTPLWLLYHRIWKSIKKSKIAKA